MIPYIEHIFSLSDIQIFVGNMLVLNRSVNMKLITARRNVDPNDIPVLAKEQDGLLQLEAESLRLDKLQRATIHLGSKRCIVMQGDMLDGNHTPFHITERCYNIESSLRFTLISPFPRLQ